MAKKKRKTKRRVFRLIPITVTMLSLLFIVKVNELYIDSRELREMYGVRDATAAEAEGKPAEGAGNTAEHAAEKPAEGKAAEGEAKPEHAATEGEAKPAEEGGHGEANAKPEKEPTTFGTGKTTLKDIEALKAKENVQRYTQSELDLLENLSRRRDELDKREKEFEIKSKVLDATEKRISDKMGEMKTMQAQLEKVVALYNEKQDTQIKSLVKIYESMKPGDAAAIFNEMDMPILLEVIDKMSERKVAPVLAGMDPKRARDVTQELAEMRRSTAGKTPAPAAPGKK